MLQAKLWLTYAEVKAATAASKVSSEVWKKALLNEPLEDPDEAAGEDDPILIEESEAETVGSTETVPSQGYA